MELERLHPEQTRKALESLKRLEPENLRAHAIPQKGSGNRNADPPSCSLDEVGGVGAEPPIALTPPVHQWSRFCRRMERTTAGKQFFFLFPVVGSAMARQNPDCQGERVEIFRAERRKYDPTLDWLDRRNGRERQKLESAERKSK
ncbi:hypothetical protein GN277_27410 [Lachnospiraceae bacterium WCA-9-b2]|uniref:Uncharacterized protein n=1 Tax=Sporofaciens musculi TaxID=2681861 RepID=A0A7X3MM19_9FIRM|nr:hypothetical protein [Sporofaciens musculi]MXP78923.1 hypothetical protein [Sporofaciens musculi]